MRKFLLLTFIFSFSAFADNYDSSSIESMQDLEQNPAQVCLSVANHLNDVSLGLQEIRKDKKFKIQVVGCDMVQDYKDSAKASIRHQKREFKKLNKLAMNSNSRY